MEDARKRPRAAPALSPNRWAVIVTVLLFSTANAQPIAPPDGGGIPLVIDADAAIPMTILGEAPYQEVDNQQGVWRSPNYPPIRPMALHPNGGTLYALNNHDSRLQVFTGQSVNTHEPEFSYRVPWLPVSLALWQDPDDDTALRILVACRGSWCVAMLDAVTGETLEIHQARHPGNGRLLAEPGDIIVDPSTNKAYVSFSADDMVVEIGLQGGMKDLRHFPLAGKHPLFLAFDPQGNVLVTPLFSGNNSVSHQNQNNPLDFEVFPRRVIDTTDPALVMPGGGLPDTDVFRINVATGVVQPVVTEAGTILFAHGINPATGDHWALSTDANNKDPNKRGVHAIAGEIVDNQLAISTLPNSSTGPVKPHTIINLDKLSDITGAGNYVYDPNGSFQPTMAMGQPFSLTFLSGGYALISSMLSDRVHALDRFGNFIFSVDLGAGDIPRQVLYHAAFGSFISYNWGTNTVDFYVANGTNVPWLELDLGYDPAPLEIQEGREIAYDGAFSAYNNASCLTCHVDGRTDGVVWDIADVELDPALANPLDGVDDKGPMLTQTLAGIKRAINFHWRAEQQQNLLDFNQAFIDLLGSNVKLDETPGGEFDKFEKFIFSIDNPANPRQHRGRVVSDNIQPVLFPGSPAAAAATGGQGQFIQTCQGCHSFPLGTMNDNVPDGAVFDNINTKQIFFKIAPFQEMWRREFDADPLTPGLQQAIVDWIDSVPDLPNSTIYAPNGAALSHGGLASGLQHFNFVFALSLQAISDVTAFIDQWDSGLAPACHRAVLIDKNATTQQINDVQGYLVGQAANAMVTGAGQRIINADLIAYGTSDMGFMEWLYDRASGLFVPSDSSLAPQPVSYFIIKGLAGTASTVFIGVPFSMGQRFGVDYDNDGLFNGDEATTTTNPYVEDHDGDTFLDGHEVVHGSDPTNASSLPNDNTAPQVVNGTLTILWNTAKAARVVFETTEPTRATVNWTDSAGASGSEVSELWSTQHSLVLIDLTPSSSPVSVNGTVLLVDRAGNPGSQALPSFTSDSFQGGPTQLKLDQLAFTSWAIALPPATGIAATATARVVERASGPPNVPKQNHVVLARVFRNGKLDTNVTGSVPNFNYNGAPYPLRNGPYVVSTVSGANGLVNFSFGLPNAVAGDEVCLVIEVVAAAPAGWNPLSPALPDNAFDSWSFSDTSKQARKICN